MNLEKKQVLVVYHKLKKKSFIYLGVVALFFLFTLLMLYLFNDSVEVTRETSWMTKTVLFVVFFGTIPLMFYYVAGKVRNIAEKQTYKKMMRSYARLYSIKFVLYTILSVLSLIGFFLTKDPMILLLFIAGIFFLYFERPSKDKIENDLAINTGLDQAE